MEFIHSKNPDLLWKNDRGLDPGDWLNGDTLLYPGWPRTGGTIPHDVFATAYFAHTTDLLSKIATAIRPHRRRTPLRGSFRSDQSRVQQGIRGSRTGAFKATRSLRMRSLWILICFPIRSAPMAIAHLLEGLQKYNGHASTGIHGTRSLMLELTSSGHNDEAYQSRHFAHVSVVGLHAGHGRDDHLGTMGRICGRNEDLMVTRR